MLSQLTQFAKCLLSHLSNAAGQLFRRATEPTSPTRVTDTLADLPRRRTELLAENALLRQQLMVLHRRNQAPRWESRVQVRLQPQRLKAETIALLEQMAHDNPLWGAERVRGELLKLNIKVAKRTVQKYLLVVRSQPPTGNRVRRS